MDERDEYERELDKAKARNGGAPILSTEANNFFRLISPRDNIPDTGFGQ